MKIALAQIAPVFLDRVATTDKIVRWIANAAEVGAAMVAFGETLLPGYPFWPCRTDGARFNADDQKAWYSLYVEQAVDLARGHLDPIRDAAKRHRVTVIAGVLERARDRGSTVFCSRVFIDAEGEVLSVHRKLIPTYEERLVWGMGDGAGLRVHRVGEFHVGALNCWENWMPLARAALYAAGEDVHVMLWPGSQRLTRDITRFVALESRGYVFSVGGLLRESDLPAWLPDRERLASKGETLYDGGTCVAGPDGSWIVEPAIGAERLILADLDPAMIRRERQNFDPAGHYARPDVFTLEVNRKRQTTAEWSD